jgi:hypothetical protein
LSLLALHDFGTGQWTELIEATTEGQQMSVDLGFVLTACLGRFARGLVAAARGEYALVEEFAEQLLWAAPRRLRTLATYASHLRCLAALGASAFDDAYRHAAMINPPGTFLARNPHALWLVLDLVNGKKSKSTQPILSWADAPAEHDPTFITGVSGECS